MSHSNPIRLLLVEDNRGDVELIREVFIECGLRTDMDVAPDGKVALERIRSHSPPEIVLLDLNLGILSGLDVLAELNRTHPEFLVKVPIIVLTSSTMARDVTQALELGAKCYHVKPTGLVEYIRLVRVIYQHWLDFAILPRYTPPVALVE